MPDASTDSIANSPLAKMVGAGGGGGMPDMPDFSARTQQQRQQMQNIAATTAGELRQSREAETEEKRSILSDLRNLSADDIAQLRTKPPQPQPTSIAEMWGSPAMIVAMIGSAFTRTPWTNALNAGAAVNNAFQQRDLEGAKRATEEWKQAQDTALKVSKIEHDYLKETLDQITNTRGEEQKEALNLAQLQFRALGNNPFADLVAMGDYSRVIEAQTKIKQQNDLAAAKAPYQIAYNDAQTRELEAERALKDAQKNNDPAAIAKAQTDITQAQSDMERAYNGALAASVFGTGPGTGIGRHAGAVGAGTTVSKSFDVIDDKGHVVRNVMAYENKAAKPGESRFIDSQTNQAVQLGPNEHLKQVTPTTSGGGRAGAQVIRQEVGGREVLSDLQNAVSLPVGTTIGPLGTVHQGTSISDALKGDLVRKLTDQDSQLMQASMASMTRELSILMSPVYGGNWAAQQIDPLVPKSGDTVSTTIFKLARLAQSADNALEAISKSPILSNEQQEFAADLRKQITEAIPWTPKEAMEFARGGETSESFGDFVKRQGISQGGTDTGPPPPAIDHLKANPALREDFDRKYGPGAAAKVLGQ